MVEVIWDAGGKPQRHTEDEASFKEMLITIVEQELNVYLDNGLWWWAARSALALDDRMPQEMILLDIMKQNGLSTGEHIAVGWLAGAIGNTALAEQTIRELEQTIGEPHCDNAIVDIVIKLPYKSTPIRLMRIFEDRGDYGQVLNIAAAIGDIETSERLLTQMITEGSVFDNTQTQLLVKAVSHNQILGRKLLKELENPREKKEWYMECAGLVAAAVGERGVAEKAFEYLKEGRRFDQLQAGRIAAALGNILDAEEMVLRVYKPVAFATLVEGDRVYSDSAGDIISSVLKENVETAERIWKHLTKVVSGTLLPMFAVRVLESI